MRSLEFGIQSFRMGGGEEADRRGSRRSWNPDPWTRTLDIAPPIPNPQSPPYTADMIAWLSALVERHEAWLGWVAAVSVAVMVLGVLVMPVVLLGLPADAVERYLRDRSRREMSPGDWRRRHPVWRWSLRVVKNLAGVVLAVAGLAMLVLPGQGLVTLAVALLLLDVPGKRRVERKLLTHPRLLGPINRWRQRFGRAPITANGAEAADAGAGAA